MFTNCIREWVASPPQLGFLFPAFHDRGADIHSVLFYKKSAKETHEGFLSEQFGCDCPIPAPEQKKVFSSLVSELLEEECKYETVCDLYDEVQEIVANSGDNAKVRELDRTAIKKLFEKCGASEEKMKQFNRLYDEKIGDREVLLAENVIDAGRLEIKTPDFLVRVSAGRSDLVEMRTIDGKPYLVIPVTDNVEIDGIATRK
jgi:hypothetical protein